MISEIDQAKTAPERRRHPRFSALERAVVAISGDTLPPLPYHLMDISQGGMAFRYLHSKPLPLTDTRMDIYLNMDLYVGRLPIEVIADHLLEGAVIPERRCGVRFGPLTQVQQLQLEAFIQFHISAALNPRITAISH